jgi:hypothetical protein
MSSTALINGLEEICNLVKETKQQTPLRASEETSFQKFYGDKQSTVFVLCP